MKEIEITMTAGQYKLYMKDDEIRGDKKKLIKYINETYGLLGTVVDIKVEA